MIRRLQHVYVVCRMNDYDRLVWSWIISSGHHWALAFPGHFGAVVPICVKFFSLLVDLCIDTITSIAQSIVHPTIRIKVRQSLILMAKVWMLTPNQRIPISPFRIDCKSTTAEAWFNMYKRDYSENKVGTFVFAWANRSADSELFKDEWMSIISRWCWANASYIVCTNAIWSKDSRCSATVSWNCG